MPQFANHHLMYWGQGLIGVITMLNKIKRFLFKQVQSLLNLRCTSVVVILEKDDSVLLFDRGDGKGYGLPGGMIDHQEKAEDAARRELEEETGFTPKNLKFLGLYDEPEKDKCIVHIYSAKFGSGQLKKDCKEGKPVWRSKAMLKEDVDFLENMAFGTGYILLQYLFESKLQVENHAFDDLPFKTLDSFFAKSHLVPA
jgi:ADP-ribose pyrophosphatase YjhB (NUDIX family)